MTYLCGHNTLVHIILATQCSQIHTLWTHAQHIRTCNFSSISSFAFGTLSLKMLWVESISRRISRGDRSGLQGIKNALLEGQEELQT